MKTKTKNLPASYYELRNIIQYLKMDYTKFMNSNDLKPGEFWDPTQLSEYLEENQLMTKKGFDTIRFLDGDVRI